MGFADSLTGPDVADRAACLRGAGYFVVQQHWEGPWDLVAGWFTIVRADPRITVSHQLLEAFALEDHRAVRLTKVCCCSPEVRLHCPHFGGGRLEITGRDRRVAYVLGELDPHMMVWTAERAE